MSNWVVAAIIVNAALVVAVIVLALHIANRSVAVAVRVDVQVSPPVAAVTELVAAPSRPPLFSASQMRRAEWHALLNAYDEAHLKYLRALVAWNKDELRNYGGLTRAHHDFEIAKRRLTRFELKASAGSPPYVS